MLTGLLAPTFGELKVLNYNIQILLAIFYNKLDICLKICYMDLTVYENLKLYVIYKILKIPIVELMTFNFYFFKKISR